MRPPRVSLFFFAAAIAFLIYAAFSGGGQPGPEPIASTLAVAETALANPHALPDFNWRFNALDPGVVEASSASASFDPADDYWGLPRTEGVDLVAGYCASCHSLRIVMQQSASEARWRELMAWMIDKQGMAQPPDDDLEQMIGYLSENFGA